MFEDLSRSVLEEFAAVAYVPKYVSGFYDGRGYTVKAFVGRPAMGKGRGKVAVIDQHGKEYESISAVALAIGTKPGNVRRALMPKSKKSGARTIKGLILHYQEAT